MRNLITLLVVFLGLSFASSAQPKQPSITGKVLDDKKAGIEAASIVLTKSDNSFTKTALATKDGSFEFSDIAIGTYKLAVSAVGFQKSETTIDFKGEKLEVPAISLLTESKDLSAVTVVSRKPMVEQKIDRTVVNVDAAVTNVGTSALEVLEKSPGIQVDKDGNISLKGKQGVIVMMDGRPTYLSGPELANLLRGMQASQLETIEIMTNPPAKFDASGNSGVINIKTKKNKAKGFNGNITAGVSQGVYFKTNESINMNYRNGKINLFGNYSFGRYNGFQELDINRVYKEEDGSTRAIFTQTSLMKSRRMNNNLKLGLDYSLDKKTTLGVVFTGFYNPESNTGNNTSYLKNPAGEVDSIVQAGSYIEELWKNGAVNLNLRRQFDTTGRELTADLDYIRYDATNQQDFLNTTMTNNWVKKYDEQLKGDLPVSIQIYSGRIDYTHPLKKGAKLEMGWKSSYVITDNRANYFEYLDGSWQPDYGKTNYFEYKENINAGYINFNKQLTKALGVQAGLRYENTSYKGFQYGNPTRQDSSFSRSYDSWFPTVYFSYTLDKKNQLGLSFGRRIDRPAYQDLNPFLFFLDKYTYGQGNPYLKPQYSNNFELTHIWNQIVTTTLNYSETKDVFAETFDQPTDNNGYSYATIVRQGNIGKRQNAGVAVNVQLTVTKWLTSMIYSNYNYSRYRGLVNGENLDVEAGNFMVNLNNQMRFNKGWGAELSGWYRTKGIEGQIMIEPMGQLSAGVTKQVMKGKGSLKLNVRDIFYTQVAKGEIKFKSTEATFVNNRDSRVVNFTFSYRFGKQFNGGGQRKRSGTEEQSRVKSGE